MYIEEQLKQLTETSAHILTLLEQLTGAALPVTAPPDKPTPKKDVQTTSITKEALQAWCLTSVREDKGFKARLMTELTKHDAKTISQLSDDVVAAVYAALGGGQ